MRTFKGLDKAIKSHGGRASTIYINAKANQVYYEYLRDGTVGGEPVSTDLPYIEVAAKCNRYIRHRYEDIERRIVASLTDFDEMSECILATWVIQEILSHNNIPYRREAADPFWTLTVQTPKNGELVVYFMNFVHHNTIPTYDMVWTPHFPPVPGPRNTLYEILDACIPEEYDHE